MDSFTHVYYLYASQLKLNKMKSEKLKHMTPFQQALIQASEGELKTPTVSTASGNINYFGYQLAVHKYNLGLMAIGMKFNGITFTQIKKYYGFKGRTAKDCMPQMVELMSAFEQALKLA